MSDPRITPASACGADSRLLAIESSADIPPRYRETPIGRLLEYHNLGAQQPVYKSAELLVGMCMDNRKHLRIPDNFAFIIRSGGANLRHSEFKVAYAIAVGGVRAIALIGHTRCGMVNLAARREQFVQGLVDNGGWDRDVAGRYFESFAPLFEIGNETDFVVSEAQRLRLRFPKVLASPLIYRVEDGRLCMVRELDAPSFRSHCIRLPPAVSSPASNMEV